jgi:hypothetical protein
VTRPVAANTASTTHGTALDTCPTRIKVRRSMTSASAPAGRVSSIRGSSSPVVTRLTISGEPVSSSISHGPAVICRNVPIALTVDAGHSRR